MLKTFAYHKPSVAGLERIQRLREAYSALAAALDEAGTPSRELSIARTELETSAMWAVKSVVHNDAGSEVDGVPA